MNVQSDYTLAETASILRVSTRWVRDAVKAHGVEHQRYGRKYTFTAVQIDALRALQTRTKRNEPVTTGPAKKRIAS